MCVCVCACPPLYSRTSRGKQEIRATSASLGQQVRAFFAYHGTLGRPFCHTCTPNTINNASQKCVSTVYIICGQFVGVNKPYRLNRYHCAEGLALQCFSLLRY